MPDERGGGFLQVEDGCRAFSIGVRCAGMKARLVLLALFLASLGAAVAAPDVRPGDIVFQTSKSNQSRAIQLATRSPYSHMGLILLRDGKPFVLEAIATVRFTPLGEWI